MSEKQGHIRPFILYPKQNIEDVRQCIVENFGHIRYELPFLNALCVDIPVEKVGSIRTNERIAKMSDDIQVSKLPVFPSSESAESRHGQRSKGRLPSGGEGVSIAVIDTGVSPHCDLTHPFNRIRRFKDFVNGRKLPYDDDGHGTHVAGIALGNGYCSGRYSGTAPGAALVALKALDEEGNGKASDILAAMQWVYDNRRLYNIRVLNLSLGVSPEERAELDPLELGANALVYAGICVISAAGNSGPAYGSISSPGISPLVLTVGTCDDSGRIPDFSSRGPAPDGWIKPDLVAPGVDIISLSSENPKGYVSHTGTSMSAPYAAGLAADYCAIYKSARPMEVKQALLRLAQPLEKADPYMQGHGMLRLT